MLEAWRIANPITAGGLAHCQAQSWLGLVTSRPNIGVLSNQIMIGSSQGQTLSNQIIVLQKIYTY